MVQKYLSHRGRFTHPDDGRSLTQTFDVSVGSGAAEYIKFSRRRGLITQHTHAA